MLQTERLTTISEDNYENGFITYGRYLEAQITTQEVLLAFNSTTNQIDNLLNDLKLEAGLTPADSLILNFGDVTSDPLEKKEYFGQTSELVKKALIDNIQLKQLDHLKTINDLQTKIKLASLYFIPDIGFRMEAAYSGSRFPFIQTGWYTTDDYSLNFSIGLQFNIFDGGKLAAEYLEQKREYEKTVLNMQNIENTLNKTISETLLKINLNYTKMEYYRTKNEFNKTTIKEKKQLFEVGTGNEIDYLQEVIKNYTEEIKMYQEMINYYQNYFTIKNIINSLD
jgi:outer membrane protein TolC